MNRNEYLNFNLFLNLIKSIKVGDKLKQGILMLSLSLSPLLQLTETCFD